MQDGFRPHLMDNSDAAAALQLSHARALRARGATAAALLHFEGLVAKPHASPALLNAFARFLQDVGEHQRAIAILRRAITLAPNDPAIRFNIGLSLLATGKLREGWPFYEAGRPLRADPMRRYSVPEWAGEPLEGKTLYLWEEQGIGDTLLFGSVIPDLRRRGANCVLECDGRLAPLFARSMPGLQVVPAGPFADLTLRGAIDYHVPLGSACRFVRTDLSRFPTPEPFLRPDASKVAAFSAAVGSLGPGLKIGLSWRSMSRTFTEKSIEICDLEPVLRLPNAHFIALQYGDIGADREEALRRFGTTLVEIPGVDRLNDIDGLAALTMACDVVVTISNVTANLAGALGQTSIVLLGPSTVWYWFQDREDSPWYANMRLVRARQPGKWTDACAKAAAILERALQ